MGSLFGVLDIAREGLAAQTTGLDVTGQNVTNATTPGYVRRTALIEALPAGASSQGGVQVAGIGRSVDAFAFARLVGEQGKQGAANARSNALAEAEGIVAPSTGSVQDKVNSFFSAIDSLSGYPIDLPTRKQVIGSAQDLAQTISSTAAGLSDLRGRLSVQASSVASEVNDRLKTIATLNSQISAAQATGQPAADLRDQRDVALRDLADRVGARGIEDAKGSMTVIAAGTALVDGNHASSLSVSTSASGDLVFQVKRPSGAVVDVTNGVHDGALGGIREARDSDVKSAADALDSYAYQLSVAVNTVQQQGVGLDGNGGRPLFAQPTQVSGAAYAMKVDPAIAGHPEYIAAAAAPGDLPSGNDNAVALARLAQTPLPNGMPPATAYASIGSDVGRAKAASDSEQQLRDATVAQAQTLNDSASGVSIEEEMANLSKFQNSFQACTKVMQTVSDLLDGFMKELG